MKKILQYWFVVLFALAAMPHVYAQRNYFRVTGSVINKGTNMPVYGATVSLSNGRGVEVTTATSLSGKFAFDSLNFIGNFTIQVSLSDYTTFSKVYSLQEGQAVFDVGSIGLENVVHILSTGDYIANNITANEILPTEGAMELFYTLNPELRGRDSVESNYKIRLPDFPRTDRSKEKNFNNQFRINRNRDNPDVSFDENIPYKNKNNLFSLNASAGIYTGNENIGFNYFRSNHPEKFVFVIWKKDKNGNPILKGPEVENRFLVYYYGSYMEGDTSMYHKADDATYGYATMWNASYKIIIIDKVLNKEVRISDPVIETSIFFNRHDLFTAFNIHLNWIKIPIQIFE